MPARRVSENCCETSLGDDRNGLEQLPRVFAQVAAPALELLQIL